jgi:hypothetical protein
MTASILERRFSAIGARLRVEGGARLGMPTIDVGADRRGEYFDVRFPGTGPKVELQVVDARPADRHLLLLARDGEAKSKFLCGHDERHWFVAAVPEAARGVTGVETAKLALQPFAVRVAAERVLRPKERFRRRNAAFVRQGEWFFVPVSGVSPRPDEVLRREPLSRGTGSKPHVLELAYRRGGAVVYLNVHSGRPISAARFERLNPNQRRAFVRQVRDPELYAKGTVRHADHATIVLGDWHRVLMNTENQATAMRHVAFID